VSGLDGGRESQADELCQSRLPTRLRIAWLPDWLRGFAVELRHPLPEPHHEVVVNQHHADAQGILLG
jgi:hypothetical protein